MLVLVVVGARPAAALGLARLGLGAALGLLDAVASAPGSGTWPRDSSLGAVLAGLGLAALVGRRAPGRAGGRSRPRSGRRCSRSLLSLLAPLLFERLFNRFEPLRRGAGARPARALGARGRAGADDARRRREPEDDEAQRVRLGARPDAAARPLRHAAARLAGGRSCAASSPTSSATAAPATSRAGRRSAMARRGRGGGRVLRVVFAWDGLVAGGRLGRPRRPADRAARPARALGCSRSARCRSRPGSRAAGSAWPTASRSS